ncbi:MAG: AbrB/MazE/SpoVT family DNA-binding domain-containing protein [Nakamurella sp.]
MVRAVVRSKGQITLPKEVRDTLHLREGDDVAFVLEAGQVTMRGMRSVPTEQAWFWTQPWQDGEKQASLQLEAGEGVVFEHADTFLDSLK